MTISKILNENPDITNEIQEFFKKKLLNSFTDKIPKSFKDKITNDGVSLEMLKTYLETTPRLICDFMDSKKIYILLGRKKDLFTFTINNNSYSFHSSSRLESEKESVIESILFYKKNFNIFSE
jgi:hypothetical protein